MHFIADEAPKRQASSMAQLITSLKSHQIDCGYTNDIFENDGQVKRILRGVKIVNSIKRRNERLPITRDIVEQLVSHCDNSFHGTTMRAAICLAFAGFLRIGEFTHNTWNSSSDQNSVSRGSISFSTTTVT